MSYFGSVVLRDANGNPIGTMGPSDSLQTHDNEAIALLQEISNKLSMLVLMIQESTDDFEFNVEEPDDRN